MEYELNKTYNVDDISELEGHTIYDIKRFDGYDDNEQIEFLCSNGFKYKMYHEQDCCEYVRIEDIDGDLSDLEGTPLTMAEESCNSKDESDGIDGSETWTFYRFATIKGYVTIRWYGSSNGYYSESISVYKELNEQAIRRYKLKLILDGE